ncbi:MAG: hypothetical protein DRG71_02005 [Deltaproteobacteria bacterium]|nr:MAG: hypothetical protein DRG71_02005 [Deltaproteobacteria bacterium]
MKRWRNLRARGMGIIPGDIVGLYVEKDRLLYCCIRKGLFGVSLKEPGPDLAPHGTITGTDYSGLRKFLDGLYPSKFEMFLALPRSTFFARDMSLPAMDLEEAWASVQNNLSVYCHLPLDEIYHDVLLSQYDDGRINALVFYAHRKEIDRILSVFDEAGKRHLLKRVVPFSMGVYHWLNMQGYRMPLTLVLPSQEGSYELGLYSDEGFLYSASWPQSEGATVGELVLEGLAAKFGNVNGEPYFLDGHNTPGLPPPKPNRLNGLPLINENPSVAAIAGALSRGRQISLDGRPVKVRQLRPWHVLLPLCVILFLLLGYLTLSSYKEVRGVGEEVKLVGARVQRLREKIKPLEKEINRLEESEKLFRDIESYVKGKPDLYKVINEIATVVPEGTWFSHLSYDKGKLTLRGTSNDALQVLKSLRKSEMFGEVRLVGSVSRNRFDNERFRIVLHLVESKGQESKRP